MPMWESCDHATAEDAYRVAHGHMEAARPDDRIVGEGGGVYAVVTAADLDATRVATIVISLGDDLTPPPPPSLAKEPSCTR